MSYRSRKAAKIAKTELRIAKKLGELMSVSQRGQTVAIYGRPIGPKTKINSQVLGTDSAQTKWVFRFATQAVLVETTDEGEQAVNIPDYWGGYENGALIHFEDVNWVVDTVSNPDSVGAVWVLDVINTHVRRLNSQK